MGSCNSTSRLVKKKPSGVRAGKQGPGSSSSAAVRERIEKGRLSVIQSKWRKLGKRKLGAGNDGGAHRPMKGMVRLWMNGASKIGNACLYTQQGKKGVNQDAMVVWENFSSTGDTLFCGVFDGHGPFGHMVSKKVRDSLPNLLYNAWKINPNGDELAANSNGGTQSENSAASLEDGIDGDEQRKPEIYRSLKEAMCAAFKQMDEELKLHPTIDCFCSGTTAVTLIKRNQDLVIGNVGDSRAVLGTRDEDNALVAVQLTVDLKPDLPKEAARIQKCKGRVFALQDEPEVARVWLPNSDSPGLAMARAFGDFCLKDYGLISIPEIYYHKINSRDEFVILATDGVWDALSNNEAVQVVASAPSRHTAARALVDCAVRAWRLKFPTSNNDDCAVVCLFLNSSKASNCSVVPRAKEAASGDGVPEAEENRGEIVALSTVEEGRSASGRRMQTLAECMAAPEDEEWSALHGVTRVNTLLSLPRYLSRNRKATKSLP